jgi:thiamine transport system substrate-binding protein
MKNQLFYLFATAFLLLSGCSPQLPAAATLIPTDVISPTAVAAVALEPTAVPTATAQTEPGKVESLTVLTHDSFAASEDVIAAFEKQNNVKVSFIKGGDTGAALNRAILSKSSPLADVMYGVDNTFLSRAESSDVFEAYQSAMLADIPDEFKLASDNLLSPVDYGDVCINYDKAYFADKKLEVPRSLEVLSRPEYKGLLIVENPATSSPGLAFMLATIKDFGVENYLDFWKSLRANDVLVVNDWETAYYTHFSGSSGKGPRPMVVSYGTSPAAEVIFADPKPEEAPTASLTGTNMCFRQVEFAGILKGTAKRALAEKFIDFLLSTEFQKDIPMQMFVFPVNSKAEIPMEFKSFVQTPEKPALLDAKDIADNRETWIEAWEEVVIR